MESAWKAAKTVEAMAEAVTLRILRRNVITSKVRT